MVNISALAWFIRSLCITGTKVHFHQTYRALANIGYRVTGIKVHFHQTYRALANIGYPVTGTKAHFPHTYCTLANISALAWFIRCLCITGAKVHFPQTYRALANIGCSVTGTKVHFHQTYRASANTGYSVYRRRQTKQKHNTICVGHNVTQTNPNKVNKSRVLIQTTGGKDEPNIFLTEFIA